MSVTFTNGDPVGFVILNREGAELHLTLDRDHEASAQNVAHLMVDNATNLSTNFKVTRSALSKGFETRTTVCADSCSLTPDGNRIDVGQNL